MPRPPRPLSELLAFLEDNGVTELIGHNLVAIDRETCAALVEIADIAFAFDHEDGVDYCRDCQHFFDGQNCDPSCAMGKARARLRACGWEAR